MRALLPDEDQHPAKHHPPHKIILLVEDDRDTREFFDLALSSRIPYPVLIATTATAALRLVQHIKPALVLLDERLPDMHWLAFYDRLHTTPGLERVPTLLISSSLDDKLRHEAEQRTLMVLENPFDWDDFLDIITRLLA